MKKINFFQQKKAKNKSVQNALKRPSPLNPTHMPSLNITSYLIEGVKNTHMNFPYHTESVSQHVDHFKQQKKLNKNVAENQLFSAKLGGGTPSWKIPRK